MSLAFSIVGLFTSAFLSGPKQTNDAKYYRDANDHARAKRFARKKRSVSRVAATNNTQEIAHKQNTFGRRMDGVTTCMP